MNNTSDDMTLDEAMRAAIAHHQQGRLAEAEQLYRAVLHAIQRLLETGNYAQALAAAAQVTSAAPAEPDAWAYLALAQIQLKDMAAADNAATQAVALAPTNPLSLRALASVRLRQQRPGDAITLARQALAVAPQHAYALMLLGSAKAMQGEFDEADALLTSALQIEPLAEAHANRAIIALQRNQMEQAMAYAEQAVLRKPFLVNIWQLLVGLYQRTGRQAQVVEALERIIAVEPGNAPALSDLGELYRRAGRLAEAQALLARAVAADPQHANAWVNYAATLHQGNDLANAIQALENALAIDPKQPMAQRNLASMYRDSGQPGKALDCYNAAIALQPDHAETFKNQADVLKSLGQMDAAVQSYRQALHLQPQLAEAHNNLGNAYKDMNRRQEAIDSFRAAIALKPDMAELHANLGHVHKRFGEFDAALAAYQAAVAHKADHGDARYGVGNVLWQLGHLDRALESFRQTMETGTGDFFSWAAAVDSGILYFLKNDLQAAQAAILRAAPIDGVLTEQARPVRAYYRYMHKLLAWWQAQPGGSARHDDAAEPLYVVGDSHCLSAHGLALNHQGQALRGHAMLVKGVKQWHLGRSGSNQQRQQLEQLWTTLPPRSKVLLTVGEIDCRMDEGIFKAWQKAGGKQPMEDFLIPTLDNFMAWASQLPQQGGHALLLCGVPACNMPLGRLSPAAQTQFLQMLELFNQQLAQRARQSGLGFVDVYGLTNAGGGKADGQWHIDQIHLRPDALQAAFNRL